MTRSLAAAGGVDLWRAPVTLFPEAIRDPQRAWAAVLVGYLAAFVPSMAIAAVVSLLLPDVGQPEFGPASLSQFLLIAGFAPVIETLIMGAVLSLLLRILSPTVAVLVSAAGWGLAHSAMAPAWGLVIWWPFLVFSILFVAWRQRSWAAGFGVAAAAHSLQNLGPALALLLAA